MIQTLIADDELLARHKLRQFLSEEPGIEIVGESSSASDTAALVRATTPELLFLDVRMPGMEGLELMAELSRSTNGSAPRVILTTAYDHYALRAFELNAVDYLLKPFTAERLHVAVERARAEIGKAAMPAGLESTRDAASSSYTSRIVFKSRGRIWFLAISDIRWINAEENYVRICTATETHLLRRTMASMEELLDPHSFLRVHRSAIVNLCSVKEVRTESKGIFIVHL